MIEILKSYRGKLTYIDEIENDTLINLINPTEDEILLIKNKFDIEEDYLKAALDEEERSRIEIEDNQMLVLVDTPIIDNENEQLIFSTIPFSIIIKDSIIITVCLRKTSLMDAFLRGIIKIINTKKRNRLTLQLLYRNATVFLQYLKQVEKESTRIEKDLHKSTKNEALIEMLGLEKSLVYLSTSLKGNEVVLEKLLRMDFVKNYPDDTELLEDVIIENKQAIEMSNIYREILSSTTEAIGSLISNKLNDVMKLLAAITIILTVPNIITSTWGMNVSVPFDRNPYGFLIVVGITILVTILVYLFAKIKKWL